MITDKITIKVPNKELTDVKRLKLLGVMIDNDLNWKDQINAIIQK